MILAATALLAPTAEANDGVFGGAGVHPIPLNSDDVRMLDEIVRLRLNPKDRAWEVSASFIFENTSSEPVTLTLGFPFPAVHSEHDEVGLPDGVTKPAQGEPLVFDFTTTVRGEPVDARRSPTGLNDDRPDLRYSFAWLWDVTFAPNERVHVVNTYRHGISATNFGGASAMYVLKTGSTWKDGRIGHARLSVEVPSARHVLCPPDQDLYDGSPISPEGAHISPNHGEPGFTLHWSLANHEPSADLYVCLVDVDHYASMHFYTQIADTNPRKLRRDARADLKHTLEALRGKPFTDPALRERFANTWWYAPDPAFSPARFTNDERALWSKLGGTSGE